MITEDYKVKQVFGAEAALYSKPHDADVLTVVDLHTSVWPKVSLMQVAGI